MTHTVEFDSVPHSEDMLPVQSPVSAATTAATAAVTSPTNSSATAEGVSFCMSSLPLSATDAVNQNTSQHSPAFSSSVPEAKKFKDSSVQVEFTTALMPSSMSSNSSQSQFLSSPAYLVALASQPSTSSADDLSRVPLPLEPHPRSVTTEELRVLQDCLQRWREEVEADVRGMCMNSVPYLCKICA